MENIMTIAPKPRGRPKGSVDKKPRAKRGSKMAVKFSLKTLPSKMSYARSSAQNLKIARQAQMSDFWINQKLGGKRQELSSDMRAASASRTILRTTSQWPWEWAAEFLPVEWTITILNDLRQLVQGIQNKQNPGLCANNYQRVKDAIGEKARMRDYQNPHLIDHDLQYAFRRYGVEPKRRQIQAPNRTMAATPATPMAPSIPLTPRIPIIPAVSLATMGDSDSSDEGSLFVSDSSSTVNEPNSSPCRKSSILSMTSASSNEEAPQPWKRPQSPVQRPETPERTHATEPEEPERMDIDNAVLNEVVTNDMINPGWDFPVSF